ncbi:MAG: hypothetical protein E8D45_05395 [Nitrospira sp.]|nr:MAG: hypothetical protein E8D45_05395 [Nitrospira sp.]
MSQQQQFWPVEFQAGEPDLWVCLSCLTEVYRRKVPMPDCPSCHGVSTFEPFALEAIRDWGTEELIAKAVSASSEPDPQPVEALTPAGIPSAEPSV